MGPRIREDTGRGMGMGPRMREDNGWGVGGDGRFANRPYGGGGVGGRGMGMGSRMREDTEGELGVRDDRFFTPLRYVQNDIWVGEGRGKEGVALGVGMVIRR